MPEQIEIIETPLEAGGSSEVSWGDLLGSTPYYDTPLDQGVDFGTEYQWSDLWGGISPESGYTEELTETALGSANRDWSVILGKMPTVSQETWAEPVPWGTGGGGFWQTVGNIGKAILKGLGGGGAGGTMEQAPASTYTKQMPVVQQSPVVNTLKNNWLSIAALVVIVAGIIALIFWRKK